MDPENGTLKDCFPLTLGVKQCGKVGVAYESIGLCLPCCAHLGLGLMSMS